MKSDYIEKANTVLFNLEEYEDTFCDLANILNHSKCVLIRNEDLDDFYANGVYVSVYKNANGYDMYFNNYRLSIDVYGKLIVDYNLVKI